MRSNHRQKHTREGQGQGEEEGETEGEEGRQEGKVGRVKRESMRPYVRTCVHTRACTHTCVCVIFFLLNFSRTENSVYECLCVS